MIIKKEVNKFKVASDRPKSLKLIFPSLRNCYFFGSLDFFRGPANFAEHYKAI